MEQVIKGVVMFAILAIIVLLMAREDSKYLKNHNLTLRNNEENRWNFLPKELKDLLSGTVGFSLAVGNTFIFRYTNEECPLLNFTVIGKIEGIHYKDNCLILQISNKEFHGIILSQQNGWMIIDSNYKHNSIIINNFLQHNYDINKADYNVTNYVRVGSFELF